MEFEDDFAGLAEALLISVGGSRVKVEKKDPAFTMSVKLYI